MREKFNIYVCFVVCGEKFVLSPFVLNFLFRGGGNKSKNISTVQTLTAQ